MHLKSVPQSWVVCWSPPSIKTEMVAVATLAGTMAEDFSNDAVLKILQLNVRDTDDNGMPVLGEVTIPEQAHQIDWSPHGGPNGIVAVACTDGSVYVYSVDGILKGSGHDPLLCRIGAHTRAVSAMKFSPTQPIFLATGSDGGEVKIWTVEKPTKPQLVPTLDRAMHDGTITDLQWNPKFAHIIAASDSNGVVKIWDLKTSKSSMSLNASAVHGTKYAATAVAWNPENQMELAVALDDPTSTIQMWNLKKAVRPERVLTGNGGGITGISWSKLDGALLAGCSVDGITSWWNAATGDCLGSLEKEAFSMNSVVWAPHTPLLLATSSVGGAVTIATATMSISGGTARASTFVPKWLQKPSCASFGFGLRVASVVASGSKTEIKLTNLQKAVQKRAGVSTDAQFHSPMVVNMPHDPEVRSGWLQERNYDALAAAAAAGGKSRQPLIDYLRVDPTVAEESADPFDQNNETDFETAVSGYLAVGLVDQAVERCVRQNRFDDAFAITCGTSFARGEKLVRYVIDAFMEQSAQRSEGDQKMRYLSYLRAIDHKDFSAIIHSDAPWKEVLATIITYGPPEEFNTKCLELGKVLEQRKNSDGAVTCYVFGGFVDEAVSVWRQQGISFHRLVQQTVALETVAGKQCKSRDFAQSLFSAAMKVADSANYAEAFPMLVKAADLQLHAAAVEADRIQHQLATKGQNIQFPYQRMPISDQPSAAVAKMFSEIAARKGEGAPAAPNPAQPVQQTPPVQPQSVAPQPRPAVPSPAGWPPQSRPQPQPSPQDYPHQGSSMNSSTSGRGFSNTPNRGEAPMGNMQGSSRIPQPEWNRQPRPEAFNPPGVPSTAPNMPPRPNGNQPMYSDPVRGAPPPAPAQRTTAPPPPPHQPQPSSAGPQNPSGFAPTTNPDPYRSQSSSNRDVFDAQPRDMRHPQSNSFGPPQPGAPNPYGSQPAPPPPQPNPAMSRGAPTPPSNAAVYRGSSNNNNMMPPPSPAGPPPPPQSQPTQQQYAGAPPPHAFAPPIASVRGPPPPPQQQQQQQAPPASAPGGQSTALPPLPNQEHQYIMDCILNILASIPNPQQRDVVWRAACELHRQLQAGMVVPEVVSGLSRFVSITDPQQRRDAWRQLSERYGQNVYSFISLKYL